MRVFYMYEYVVVCGPGTLIDPMYTYTAICKRLGEEEELDAEGQLNEAAVIHLEVRFFARMNGGMELIVSNTYLYTHNTHAAGVRAGGAREALGGV